MKHTPGIVLAVLLIYASGCSKSTTTDHGDQVSVERKGGDVTVKVDSKSGDNIDFKVNNDGVALPAGFPKDFPLQPKSSIKMASTAGKDTVVGVLCKSSVADTSKFYQNALTNAGWKLAAPMPMGPGVMLTAEKGTQTFLIMINKGNGGESYAQLNFSPEKH